MPKPKPLTRVQQLENAAFLRHLRRTGNACAAARALGLGRDRFTKRRSKYPVFAVKWDAALALAHAELAPVRGDGRAPRVPSGEPYISRSNAGRFQLRVTRPGKIDHAGRQRFLAALSATANVLLSAAAAGFTPRNLYYHRQHNPAFAREWLLALQLGYDRLELALLESTLPESFEDDHWRHNEPPAIPPMTANQALQLLYLHQKEARLWTTPVPDRLRPGETWEARSVMLGMIAEARRERDRLAFRIAEAERLARGEPTYIDWAAEGVTLPDLSQVTGWSRAKLPAGSAADSETANARPAGGPSDGAGLARRGPVHQPDRALFGGWRMGEIPAKKRKK